MLVVLVLTGFGSNFRCILTVFSLQVDCIWSAVMCAMSLSHISVQLVASFCFLHLQSVWRWHWCF